MAPTCATPGCTRPIFWDALCKRHDQERLGFTQPKPIRGGAPRPICQHPGCTAPVRCLRDGLCMTHYQRERRGRLANV